MTWQISGSCKDPHLADGRVGVGEVSVFSSRSEKGINPPHAPSFLPLSAWTAES